MSLILIVEDDPFLGLELKKHLTTHGFEVLGIATSNARGLKLLNGKGCDAVVLDVNLGSETSVPIAIELQVRNIPFVAVTGYSAEQCPPEIRRGTILSKPVRIQKLVEELHKTIPQR